MSLSDHTHPEDKRVVLTSSREAFIAAAQQGRFAILKREPGEYEISKGALQQAWNQSEQLRQLNFAENYSVNYSNSFYNLLPVEADDTMRGEFESLFCLFNDIHGYDANMGEAHSRFSHPVNGWDNHAHDYFNVLNTVIGGEGQSGTIIYDNISVDCGDYLYIPKGFLHKPSLPDHSMRITLAVHGIKI